MSRKFLVWALVTAMAPFSLSAQSAPTRPSPSSIRGAYGNLPLTFEINQGQTSPQVRFLSRGPAYTAFLTSDGMVLSLRPKGLLLSNSGKTRSTAQQRHSLQFKLVGAAKNPVVAGEDIQPGRVNYFFGQNPKMWRTNVATYGRVRYKNIYSGIDLVYYGNHRQLEYDFELRPGADPRLIEFEVQGASHLELDANQNLVVRIGKDKLTFENPAVYQVIKSQQVAVDGTYILQDSTHVSFRVGHYDSNQPLVIDPVLLYSTYLGGSGNDNAKGIAVDAAGNAYVAGYTDSVDFLLATTGSLASGSPHVFVAKLNATGSNLIYTDYLGGNSQDFGYALALDSANEVWVTGSTASSNFPVVHAYQADFSGSFNAFLTKISSDGSSLLYSTYLGGNGSDIPAGIGLDAAGNVTIGGSTSSTNFPVANAYQANASPNQGGLYGNYGFLTRFSPDGTSLIYSTYLGGSSNVPDDCGGTPCWTEPQSSIVGLAVDASGNAYTTGTTNTYDFPVTTGAYLTTDSTQSNSLVGFVTKFNSSGTPAYSTYFYESSGLLTNITALAVDTSGSAYVGGQAYSDGTFPITTTNICDPGSDGFACSFAFVTKFDPTGSTLSYSTFLGPNNWATPSSITVDANNDAHILTVTASNSYSLINALEPYSAGNDLLLVELDPTGTSQLSATYLGGSSDESYGAVTSDSSGNLYVTGTTTSSDFPVTPGVFQSANAGNVDSFVMKIGPTSAPGAAFNPSTLQYGSLSVGSTSAPQSVLLRNMGSAPLSLTSVTTTGDFAQTNNCATDVSAAGSCSVSVTFTPTNPGQRTGTLVFQDNAASSPQVVTLMGTGLGGLVSTAPSSLIFAATPVGVTTAPQTVTLTNTGNAPVNIAGIQTSGSYSQSNTCTSIMAPAASCTVNVTFTPTTTGTNNGSLTINDDAVVTPQTVPLTGVGSASVGTVSVTPSSLTFAATPLGVASAPQPVTLSNTGNAPVHIASIQISGSYAQSNTCTATMAPDSTCTVNVTFTPTITGTNTGTLTLNDDATGSPQSVQLTGVGSDFGVTATPTTATVKSGSSTTYQLTISSIGGTFANAVKLTCTAPAKATCSLSPSTLTPGQTNGTAVLTVNATPGTSSSASASRSSGPTYLALWISFPGLAVFGMIIPGRRKSSIRGRLMLFVLLAAQLMFLVGCAGGTGIISQGSGTPPGTYTVTVVGTSGNLQHSLPLTLVVQ